MRRLIDLWAERTTALGSRDDVAYVLVFENRGAAVGATISHPHGQIYAYDHVPERPARFLTSPRRSLQSARSSTTSTGPRSCPGLRFIPQRSRSRLVARGTVAELTDGERTSLARLIVDTCRRLDALFQCELPYMMWIDQRPFDGSLPDATIAIEFVSPWRDRDLPRCIAAAEIGAGEYFNPVVPEELAQRLRAL